MICCEKKFFATGKLEATYCVCGCAATRFYKRNVIMKNGTKQTIYSARCPLHILTYEHTVTTFGTPDLILIDEEEYVIAKVMES